MKTGIHRTGVNTPTSPASWGWAGAGPGAGGRGRGGQQSGDRSVTNVEIWLGWLIWSPLPPTPRNGLKVPLSGTVMLGRDEARLRCPGSVSKPKRSKSRFVSPAMQI